MGFSEPSSNRINRSRRVGCMMDHQSRSTKVERRQVAVVTLGTTNMSIQTFSKTKTVNYYANPCKPDSSHFTAVCKNDGTRRGFSSNQEILEIGQNLGPAGL